MKKKIMIVGAGWMGCHLAYSLKLRGYNISLFDQKNIFNGMSGSNTNRLHMGYHYPRSYQTRIQSKEGYTSFIKKYPQLVKQIKNNLIYILKKESLIDFYTYKKVMISTGLKIKSTKFFENELTNVEGLLKVDEAQILQDKSKKFFQFKLKKNFFKNKKIDISQIEFKKNRFIYKNTKFDHIIDCTAGHMTKYKNFDISFEPRVTFVYRSKLKSFALMAMDGPFYNIFPYGKRDYILGTPMFSKFKKFSNLNRAIHFLKNIKKETLLKRQLGSEKIVKKSFNNFDKYFYFKNCFFSLTTIFYSKSDNRPTLVKKNKNIIFVLGGKIDTIFEAEKKILKLID